MVKFTESEGTLICTFSGLLNTAACNEIDADLKEHIENTTGNVVFEMSDVDYIASSFLRMCIFTAKTVGTERFNIINTKKEIYDIFEMSGLDDLIKDE
ncbi:MAG: STAS domain-containing protein [Abditibacteriota bacterium]|nr:STAS domain-containing protein [Abditibacteriota bacterium]